MTKQITLILDGVEQVATIPSKAAAKAKEVDTAVYTLSTKNALKFSVKAMETLGVKLGDEVTYIQLGERHFLAKTNPEIGEGFTITKLGNTQNYKRLNHPVLWAALKGNDKAVNKYELSEPIVSKIGGDKEMTVYELLFKETNKKKATNSKSKPAATGKGNNASVKRLRPVHVDNILTFDLPFSKVN